MKILICGSRDWYDKNLIRKVLIDIKEREVIECIIHGDARGADRCAEVVANTLGISVISCSPDWDKYGKSAGLIRNRQMLDEGKPDLVLAFSDHFETSKGTQHMVKIANDAGIPTRIFSSEYQHLI